MSLAYHSESDGATERANWTIMQMIRQSIGTNQRDWVSKLPAMEFTINSARLPRLLNWNQAPARKYPGVRVFAQRLQSAIMAAHNSILAA
ncbi:hypothetical protein J132_10866 [Termitomyces sp. J132]|nr:hypothetical protein J132_10866 [Termitomyces sp. J132]